MENRDGRVEEMKAEMPALMTVYARRSSKQPGRKRNGMVLEVEEESNRMVKESLELDA